MADKEVRRFSRKPKEIPLVIGNEQGIDEHYILRELVGEKRDRFLEVMSKKAKTDEKGQHVGFKDFKGLCSDLLSMCLFDAQNQLVPPTALATWPSSLTDELTDMAGKLSGLDKEARDRTKKQSPESD